MWARAGPRSAAGRRFVCVGVAVTGAVTVPPVPRSRCYAVVGDSELTLESQPNPSQSRSRPSTVPCANMCVREFERSRSFFKALFKPESMSELRNLKSESGIGG